jgi:hypothetical protein
MLNEDIINRYKQLKDKKDAAYTVLKVEPSVTNAFRYTTAIQKLSNFCVDIVADAANIPDTDISDKEILAHFQNYSDCFCCQGEGRESKLLTKIDNNHLIRHSNFVPQFPGMCHSCMVEHCLGTDCNSCYPYIDNPKQKQDPATCSYREIKNIYLQSNS